MEEAFAMQMFEKAMDEKFLNRVIRSMRGCPDSDVYVEALENYTYLFATVTTENVDDVLAKRRLLANVYLKRERYDEAIEQIKYMLSVEKDNVEKANLYYLWGNILERQGNNQTAAFRYKSAVGLNPNFGNAFYRLAIMYSKNKFTSDPLKDSYRYLLCIDKLERAKECIQQHAGSATMSKYNNASINDINGYIASFKSMCPLQTEAFMLGAEYSTPGRTFTFPGGVMKGEKTTIRFY
jgi:tetratricopeptide (TPR) repeat protein